MKAPIISRDERLFNPRFELTIAILHLKRAIERSNLGRFINRIVDYIELMLNNINK